MSTSLVALKESADAFPPLKSAVGGVLAVWNIAERSKHCKSEARAIALRTQEILEVIADAVPDASLIPPPMLLSIERFTALLDDICGSIEPIALGRCLPNIVYLNRNERVLQDIKSRLDDSYRDFMAASALRVEAQQMELALQQTQLLAQQLCTHMAVGEVADTLSPGLSTILYYSKLSVFLASP
ncbi:hypothetical protein DFH06DRAFT_1345792 [Mycena polygramma]|nr:hypothetical protein DFH06DRAFT_1345792 [Mycena polygramma]